MHNRPTRETGQWFAESVPTAADLQRMDTDQASSINGDAGGDWYPFDPVILGGSGLVTNADTNFASGGVRTAAGGRLQLGNNDVPIFNAARTKQRTYTLANPRPPAGQRFQVDVNLSPPGVVTLDSTGGGNNWVHEIPPLLMHKGATLSTIDLKLRIGKTHTAVPFGLPAFEFFRVSSVGAAQSLLSTLTAVLAPPADADAYYAAGATQTITMTTDQNNVIDPTTYTYLLFVADESGAGALAAPLNLYLSLVLHFTNISDLRFE